MHRRPAHGDPVLRRRRETIRDARRARRHPADVLASGSSSTCASWRASSPPAGLVALIEDRAHLRRSGSRSRRSSGSTRVPACSRRRHGLDLRTMIVSHAFQDLPRRAAGPRPRVRRADHGGPGGDPHAGHALRARRRERRHRQHPGGHRRAARAVRGGRCSASGCWWCPGLPLHRGAARKETLLVTSVGFCFALALAGPGAGALGGARRIPRGRAHLGGRRGRATWSRWWSRCGTCSPASSSCRSACCFDPPAALRDWPLVLALTAGGARRQVGRRHRGDVPLGTAGAHRGAGRHEPHPDRRVLLRHRRDRGPG